MFNLFIIILFIFSAISKAIIDKLQYHFYESVFNSEKFNPLFWNPEISWKNKYKNGNVLDGPKFFGSTTIFVFITDAWHLFNTIMFTSIDIIICLLLNNIIDGGFTLHFLYLFITFKLIRNIFFELFWRYILIKK